jgi:hypothetical protein
MKALLDPSYGWQNHPAVKMWRGHESALLEYQRAICNEWTGRGYKDTCLEKTIALIGNVVGSIPKWVGNEKVHLSHRSNLLRKSPDHYKSLFEDNLNPDIEYCWPTEEIAN